MPIDLYPNIAKVKRNGVYQNLPGFVKQSGDADIEAMIANKETSTTAQFAHANGSYFILNDILYKATTDISVNDIIAVGTNCIVAVLGNDVTNIKNELTSQSADIDDIDDMLFETEVSRNIYTPVSTYIYPNQGTASIADDKTINISNVPSTGVSVWLAAPEDLTLSAGDYTLCIDEGLYKYGKVVVAIQSNQGGSYENIVSATGDVTPFTLANDLNPKIRVAVYNSSYSPQTDLNWSGHIWICRGSYQDYMPVGEETKSAKGLVYEDQGIENAGKLLGIDENGAVTPVDNKAETAVQETIYQYGNLLDYEEVDKGYIKSDGTVQPYNSLWCSGFVPIKEGTLYCNPVGGSIVYSQYFAFYDEDKQLIESYSTTGAMSSLTISVYYIAVPEGSKYFRCTFSNDQKEAKTAWISNTPENPYPKDSFNVDDVYPYTMNPKNPCDYSELTVRAFSKVVCIGDSLTYGGFNLTNSSGSSGNIQSNAELSERYSYPSNFERITGIETVNEGASGETTVSWYEHHSNDDFSEYDLAIIHLGVNDSAFSVSDSDTLTAMQNIVTMLNNARSDMRIAICSVIPAYDGAGYQAKGQLILNWAKSLNNPNIIPLDLAAYSHVRPKTSYVAGHCSALGYYMMAYDIARYISWYMDNHKRDFRFIQFIGSPDAEWSGD